MIHRFHPFTCRCDECSENERIHAQHVTRAMPVAALPASEVSLQEVLSDQHGRAASLRYEIGEDWSDD